jgi:hypothetical protein
MADTPNTAHTGAPIPDAQAGTSAVQLDQSQVQPTPNAMEEDQSQKGPVASPDGKIPPVQQNVDVTNNSQQMPTENADTSNLGLNPDDPKNKMQQTPAYQTPSQHPAVQKASLLNEIATTLAGGPRYSTTIDPNTGTVTRTKVPLSTKQLGMAIALEALSGAITGAAQHGPNHVEAAAAAGYQQGQQESQQVQQANQANEDQAKNDYATKAMIAHTNFQTYQNAVTLGKLEYDANHEQDAAHAPMIDALRNQGGLLDEGLRGNVADLAKKYNVGQDLFIRQNTVPRLDPTTGQQAKDPETGRLLWDGEYALIDPKAKISVPDETLKYLADHHVQGFYRMDENGKSVPINLPTNTQMRAVVAANAMSAASAIQVGDHAMTGQLAQLKDGDKFVSEFHKNYEDAYNTVDPSALKVFSRYAAVPLDQLQAVMIKDKVDPDTRGQIMSLIPTGAVEASQKVADQKKADAATAAAVEREKAIAPIKEGEHRADVNANAGAAGATETARLNAEIAVRTAHGLSPLPGGAAAGAMGTENMTHPELAQYAEDDKNYNTPDGTNQAFLQAMMKIDPERARTIQAYAKGMDRQSFYAAAKAYGGGFNADLHTYDPSYNVSDVDKYFQAQKELGLGGKQQKTNAAFNTAVQHIAKLHDSIGIGSTVGMSGAFKNHLNNAATEQASFYANGNKPNEPEIAHNRDMYNSLNPIVSISATKSSLEDMMDKQVANYDSMDASLPKGVRRPFFMSQQAAQDYTRVTGKQVDNRLVYHPPDGSTPTYNNTGVVVAYTLPNGQHVNAFGQGANDFGQNAAATNGNGGPGAPHVIPAGAQPAMRNGVTVGYRDAKGNVTMF